MTSASKGHSRKGGLEKIVQIFAASRKGHCFGGASKQDFFRKESAYSQLLQENIDTVDFTQQFSVL